MFIATLLALSIARADVTCTQNCESIALSEGINYGISQLVRKKTAPRRSPEAAVIHCLIVGSKPTERWPCDSVEVSSTSEPPRIYRGERIVLVGRPESASGVTTVRRTKCPGDERKIQIRDGAVAAIEFREADCAKL